MRALLQQMFKTTLQKFWWLFFYILVVENFLVLLWAYAVQGQAGEGQTYSISGVYSMAMLCSAAASLAGGLVGFLFGVPQVTGDAQLSGTVVAASGTSARPPKAGEAAPEPDRSLVTRVSAGEAPSARLRPNTNLEQISDGLTKALLGIGLTQIHNLPGWVRASGTFLGGSFGPGRAGELVAISVLVYGFLEGLLFTYVTTRIYLTRAFGNGDPT